MFAIGVIELIILLLFLVGYKKKYTYGAVLALHAVSTLSSFKQYLAPFDGPNLLFFCSLTDVGGLFCIIPTARSGREVEYQLIVRREWG